MAIDMNALREAYATEIVEGMDIDALGQFVYEKIMENLDDYNDIELIDRINEFAPHLLKEEE
jgi:hypothetical protein